MSGTGPLAGASTCVLQANLGDVQFSFCGIIRPVSVFCRLVFLLVLLLFTFVGFIGMHWFVMVLCAVVEGLALVLGSPHSRVGSQVHVLGTQVGG